MQTNAEPQSEQSSWIPSRQVTVRRGGGATLRWLLAGAGYGLLVVAWVFASPIGAAPDEAAHAVRAAGAGAGQWWGTPATPYVRTPERPPAQAAILNAQAQQFTVPSDLLLADPPCFAGRTDESAACVYQQPAPSPGTTRAATYETTAPPGAYALAGIAMRLPGGLLASGYLGRLALALVCALLLAGAAWAACVRGALWPPAGLALGATPMVLFLGSSLGTAGVAAVAALTFTTGALAHSLGPPRRGLALLVAVSGAILGLVSAGGAVALAALVLVLLPLTRRERLTSGGAVLASAVVTAALAGGLVLALNHRPLPPGGADLGLALQTVVQAAPSLLQQSIGVFGLTDVGLPLVAYGLWGGLVVIGVSAALVLGRWRDRIALVLAVGLALFLGVAAQALVLEPVGWTLRGSFLLPVLVAIPVVSGYILHAARVHPRTDAVLVGLVVAGVQVLALWENARRYAVGRHGTLSFLDVAQWAPPGSWLPWVALAAVGGLLLVLSLMPLTRREADEEAWGPLVVVDPISISR